MIFAGRKKYLEYNLNYMRKLLNENLIMKFIYGYTLKI